MNKLSLLLAGLLFASAAGAQVAVQNLPSGSAISGGDYAICDQSAVTNKCTYTQVAAFSTGYITSQANTWSATQTMNILGTASGLSGTPALPDGTTATTQTTGDDTTKLATDAFVIANASSSGVSSVAAGPGIVITGTGTGPYTGAVTIGSTSPSRTVTSSPTVASTDMGGQIVVNVSGGGTITIPAISSTVFASGMSLSLVNYSASPAAISSIPTINAGGGCASGTGIPSGDSWQLLSNGTTIDCIQTVSASSGGSPAFSSIASGTNTTADMVVGSGASLTTTNNLNILGSSTGYTTLESANSSATNYVATLPAATSTVAEVGVAQTFSAIQTYSSRITIVNNPSATNYALGFTGTPYSGGTGTTTYPFIYLDNSATGPTTWSTGGTEIGINGFSGFTGNFLDFHLNGGSSVFSVSSTGALTASAESVGPTPSISSGFGTSAAIGSGTTAISFTVNVGTGGTASSGVIAFSAAAPNRWACSADDDGTTPTGVTRISAQTPTTVTVTNYSPTAALTPLAWTASEFVDISCVAH